MKSMTLWMAVMFFVFSISCNDDSGSSAQSTDDSESAEEKETASVEGESEPETGDPGDSEPDEGDSDTPDTTDESSDPETDRTTDETDTDEPSTEHGTADDVCTEVFCSSHGTCEIQDGEPVCICDENYTASGLACVKTPEVVDVTNMTVENGAVVSASEAFVQEALSAVVSTTGAAITDAVVDSELSSAAIIYKSCPLIYTDGPQVRKMFADFNVCACRNQGLRGVAYVERQTGDLTMTFLKNNDYVDYSFPNGQLSQWDDECEAEGDPLGDAPVDEHDWARFQAGNYFISGQSTLTRITDVKDLVAGTIGFGFSTGDEMPLTFEQAVMPNTEELKPEEHVYYISKPVTIAIPASFNSSLVLKGLDSEDLVIPDFYVHFKGQLELDGALSVVAGGPHDVPVTDWDTISLSDPTLDLLCSKPIRTTPDCTPEVTFGQMSFEVDLGGVTIQVPASAPGRIDSLGHHIGGDDEACYKEDNNRNTCICPTEGMSFEMTMPYLTVGIINPVLNFLGTTGNDMPEPVAETDTDTVTEPEEPALQVFGRFEVSINFGFGFEIDEKACTSPDAIEMFYLGQDVINTNVSYEDVYCVFDQTLYMFCSQESPEAWEEEIYVAWSARETALDGWNDKTGDESLTIGIDGESLVEMLNNQAICSNICKVPGCTLEETGWTDPTFCEYSYMLPFGTCEGVDCEAGEICNPVTNTCVGCISDQDCPDETPTCTATGKCVACENDDDCTDGECKGGVCEASPCGPCEYKCREETICPECARNEDCDGDDVCCGQLCDDGFKYTCVACYNNEHCPSGQCDMSTYTCKGGCQTDDDCSGAAPACDTETGQCVDCTADNDTFCTDKGKVCETTTHQCVECVVNDDCPVGAPVCKPSEESQPFTCVQCLDDEDCDTTCNLKFNRCNCTTSADCPDETNQKCQVKVCSE